MCCMLTCSSRRTFWAWAGVIPLAKTAPDVVVRALKLKQLTGEICKVVAGRHTHPIAMTVGGFTHYPTLDQLHELREKLESARPDVEETVALYQTLPFPEFERETEQIDAVPEKTNTRGSMA